MYVVAIGNPEHSIAQGQKSIVCVFWLRFEIIDIRW